MESADEDGRLTDSSGDVGVGSCEISMIAEIRSYTTNTHGRPTVQQARSAYAIFVSCELWTARSRTEEGELRAEKLELNFGRD